jgi:DNA-binding NarL/FixJ family response regulator
MAANMTTWHADTPPWYRDAAERVCTPKQLEVLKLASHHSDRNTARILGVSRESVRGHREAAYRRIVEYSRQQREGAA